MIVKRTFFSLCLKVRQSFFQLSYFYKSLDKLLCQTIHGIVIQSKLNVMNSITLHELTKFLGDEQKPAVQDNLFWQPI